MEAPETIEQTRPASAVPPLATERLALRPFVRSDAEDVFAYCKNPRIGHDAGWPPHETIEDSYAFIDEVASAGHVWAIVPVETVSSERPQGTVIGSIGLIADPARENDRALMLGYSIGEDWWGRGFTTEATQRVLTYAFECLDLNIVTATCYPHNTASKRVIEKCGFSFEGTRRQAALGSDGIVHDYLCHSLTEDEWAAHRA